MYELPVRNMTPSPNSIRQPPWMTL